MGLNGFESYIFVRSSAARCRAALILSSHGSAAYSGKRVNVFVNDAPLRAGEEPLTRNTGACHVPRAGAVRCTQQCDEMDTQDVPFISGIHWGEA